MTGKMRGEKAAVFASKNSSLGVNDSALFLQFTASALDSTVIGKQA